MIASTLGTIVLILVVWSDVATASAGGEDTGLAPGKPEICLPRGRRCFSGDFVKCCKGLVCIKPSGNFIRDSFCSRPKCLSPGTRCDPYKNKCCKGLECRKQAPYAKDHFCVKPKCLLRNQRCIPLEKPSCCKGLECKKLAPFARDFVCSQGKCLHLHKRCIPGSYPGCCKGFECRKRAGSHHTKDFFCFLSILQFPTSK